MACAWFMKSREAHGDLSNMTGGMPIVIEREGERMVFPSSEHLYQCGRYPHWPDTQHRIADIPSAMPAKKEAWKWVDRTRTDWQTINVPWMLWVLRQKLGCNWPRFGDALEATGDRTIVEKSSRDPFWGALYRGDGLLHGRNVLGHLLMELRDWKRRGGTAEVARDGACPVSMTLFGKAL